jgi:hypothetical protein
MALRQIEYAGVTITAAAFEVADTGRFLVALSMASVSAGCDRRYAQFLDPPSRDGLFDSIEEALDSAISFGRAIVDDDMPGGDVEHLGSGPK